MSKRRLESLAKTLRDEAYRAKNEIKTPRIPKPYFISYLLRDVTEHRLEARFGTVYRRDEKRWRRCFADVRVGSHRTDQVRDGGLRGNDTKAESYAYTKLPIGAHPAGLRHALWQLTESRYREAAEDLFEKRADSLHFRNPNDAFRAFSSSDPVTDISVPRFERVDAEAWLSFVKKASRVGVDEPGVAASDVILRVRQTSRIFVSTDGSVIVDRQPLWQLSANLEIVSEGGVVVPWKISHFVTTGRELPNIRQLVREIRAGFATMRANRERTNVTSVLGTGAARPAPRRIAHARGARPPLGGEPLARVG